MASYREIIEGLKILAKHDPDGEDGQIGGANHDIIYSSIDPEDVPEEDALRLEALGWHPDSETESWARFV